MAKKSSTYCFCEAARFSGGYLATPSTEVIEISLKFEKTHDANSICKNSTEICNLNFIELSEKTLNDACSNVQVHRCFSDLLQHVVTFKPFAEPTNTSSIVDATPTVATTNVTIHQPEDINDTKTDIKCIKRNSSLRSSMKSSHSMETILEKAAARTDESKAKSVDHLNDDEEEGYEYIENGESIELIFISDEFVNKVQKQEQEVIVLDEKDGKRRESLTGKNKIVIITDEYKQKVLRNNSIIIAGEKKMLKKLKRAKTYNTSSILQYDEPFDKEMESKKIDMLLRDRSNVH